SRTSGSRAFLAKPFSALSQRIDELPPVDCERRSGNIAPGIRGEKQRRAGEVFALAEAPLRDALEQRVGKALVDEIPVHVGFDIARAQDVHANPVTRQL